MHSLSSYTKISFYGGKELLDHQQLMSLYDGDWKDRHDFFVLWSIDLNQVKGVLAFDSIITGHG